MLDPGRAMGVARELPACYLRVDAAETALAGAGMLVEIAGYAVVHELAVSNLDSVTTLWWTQ